MNHVYRIIWNRARSCWQVVSELTKSTGKTKRRKCRSLQRMTLGLGCVLVVGVMPLGSLAYAAESEGEEQQTDYDLPALTVEAKRPEWESKLSPGTVTIIRPEDYKGEQKSLPDLLKDVPGVHVREVNGKGQYTTVSVRGSTAAQVGLFVDGVLFNLGGDAAADISTIPIKNVERIEVYRGYIPARFGGTFMGGVINIVTKRPTKENITASIGQRSYGGYIGSLQVDAPLGSGSLMVGINREQSEGDFKYKNYASDEQVAAYASQIEQRKNSLTTVADQGIATFNNVDTRSGYETVATKQTLSDAQAEYYRNNPEEWVKFATEALPGGQTALYEAEYQALYDYGYQRLITSKIYTGDSSANPNGIISDVKGYAQTYYRELYNDMSINISYAEIAADPAKYLDVYANYVAKINTEFWQPDGTMMQSLMADIEKYEKLKAELGDGTRWRRYNDYKNTDAIVKWQDDHWTVKGAWKEIDRHLPQQLWDTPGMEFAGISSGRDADAHGETGRSVNMDKKQKITTKELQVGRRDNVGNLEWGWSANYLDSNKSYRNNSRWFKDLSYYWKIPFREWSRYDSDRWGGMLDGTYKAGDNHLIEFMVNYSDEKMHIAGSMVTDGTNPDTVRYRTFYKQKMFNAQVQDTIALGKGGDLWLTPSIRYNSSTTFGSSPLEGDYQHKWNQQAEETQSKTTWQLALKKQVNDNFALRATGGTYFRLLNLYEIAGDGAGILPAPRSDLNGNLISLFPLPEEGKQWDVSALWDGRTLGADSKLQLTYFGRNAKNLLQLWRYGYDYWSYSNSAEGRARGVEMQANLKWDKWDLDLAATYTDTKARIKNDSPTGTNTYRNAKQAYAPEWEGSLRLGYRPDNRTLLFSEVKYLGEMFTESTKVNSSNQWYGQDALTTIGLGAKYKFYQGLEVIVGVNDVFNKGPKLKAYNNLQSEGYNVAFPIQGRTYYATMSYTF
ncbi:MULTISPECIES: TonB-dependent receptor domain-containing protein [Pelosinus]|uniref:TonB-dependent receptor plug n=1 Tax=Pelosinus fermentans B4 TaxID=1149862 RepID=I9L7A6_9FIRM|nr:MULTISPECIES: TonB-dependent receptor [Pelosinus]EIW16254.1 TonB-dependent receptor plug [Pelosinus fermentans B4]EIW22765.1 TonB-dependent receptor plug [Pelosinus fermentans A11]OAM95561.1 TonB-dependent receptor plug [Pelosinus fermentans DSM 17108]SDR29823.1 vitamin B12 transporter [Pelosinus fermentans]